MKTLKIFLSLFVFSLISVTTFAQLRVDAGGNVGVGTTTPGDALHVNGNVRIEKGNNIRAIRQNGDVHETFVLDANDDFVFNFSAVTIFGNRPSAVIMPVGVDKFFDIRDADLNPIMRAEEATGNIALGSYSPSYKLHLASGDAAKPGGGDWIAASDRRLKKDIKPYTDGLEEVMKINPVTFKYNGKGGFSEDGKDHVGVIAQEIQKVAPYTVKPYIHKEVEAIYTKERGNQEIVKSQEEYLSYDGTAVQYMLVNAIKEQQAVIEELQAKIEKLENNNNTIGTTNGVNQTTISFDGSEQTPMLAQNAPNPFTSNTSIEYFIPKEMDVFQASLRIFDVNGTLIKESPIAESGPGKIYIEAGALSTGNYFYSLILDGEILDSKKMVITK